MVVEVDVRDRLLERHERLLNVEARAEQAVLLAVPQGEDHRTTGRPVFRDLPPDRQHRREPRRVVGRAVADGVGRVRSGARRADVVVVSANDHVLVRELRAGNQREDVGPVLERLLERVVTRP